MTSSSAEHPWLDGRFASPDTLVIPERLLAFLAGNTAAGSLDGVRTDWSFLDSAWHRAGLEVILQTHLFAGYPRTINALATVHDVGVSCEVAELEAEDDPGNDRIRWRQAGKDLCSEIYGTAYGKLRDRIRVLHPDLETWMLELGYGRVLSRPGLTIRQRELAVVAVLAGQNVPAQLLSHLRGALRVGATREECASVLEYANEIWGAEAGEQAQNVWLAMISK